MLSSLQHCLLYPAEASSNALRGLSKPKRLFAFGHANLKDIIQDIQQVAQLIESLDKDHTNEVCTIIYANLRYIAEDHLTRHADVPLNDAEKKCLMQVALILNAMLEQENIDETTQKKLRDGLSQMIEVLDYFNIWDWAAAQDDEVSDSSAAQENTITNELEEQIHDLEKDELAVRLSPIPFDSNCNYWDELEQLIGLQTVKDELRKQIASYHFQQERQRQHPDLKPSLSFSCLFLGNPGTGKTTVARLLSGILRQEGLLRKGHYIETKASELISPYVGQSAKNTQLAAYKAMDGLLFIDEAYALAGKTSNKGNATSDVIDTLTPIMENYRGRLCVVLAGYNKEMLNLLTSVNTGFASRFQSTISFEDYNADEMMQIFLKMTEESHFRFSSSVKARVYAMFACFDEIRNALPAFANARTIRNVFEKMVARAALRNEEEKRQGQKSDVDTLVMSDTELTDSEILAVLGIMQSVPAMPATEDYIQHLKNLLGKLTHANQPRYALTEEKFESPSRSNKNCGILMTDMQKLAVKFFGDLSATIQTEEGTKQTIDLSQHLYDQLIGAYCAAMTQLGNDYTLLDTSSDEYAPILAADNSWRGYVRVLDKFFETHTFAETPSLFIVGGQDIIPSPIVGNPIYQFVQDNKKDIRERDIEADLLYCFSSRQCAAVNPSDGFVDVNMLFSDGIRCFVGRLPMEDGVLSTKRRDEIMAYFGRAINQFQPSPNKPLGLEVESVLGTACESCRRVAGVMMEGLPLLRLNEEKGITENDIFVSPQLNFEEGHNTVDDLITHSVGGQHYHNAAQHADMLTFMLHGSPAPEGRGYFGENYEKTTNTLAFSPELFQTYPAKIVSGICCWGARYVNYRVEDSALLTALSNNVLLFTGSCRSAWGIFDVLMPQDEDVISCAEVLIDRYNRYLLQGQPAGLALYNAKMDCINTTDTEDAMPYNLCTILEFNLFGDPLLSVIQEETAYDWQTASVSPMAKQILSQRIQYETEPQNEENMSLLERMRKRTNVNLEFIRERVNRELYERCGLTPQSLAAIITAKKNGTECGYIFRYTKQNGALVSHTLAHTDTQGHIHTVISSL